MFSQPLSPGDTPAALDQCPRGWTSFPHGAVCIQVRDKNQQGLVLDLKDPEAESTEATRDSGAKTSRCDTPEEIQMCVSSAVATLLARSGAADIWRRQDVVTYTDRLLQLTMQGLSVGQDYKPDTKDIHKVCKTVLNELQRTYGGRRKLRSAILSEQPKEEEAIVRCLQACITQHCVGSAHEKQKNKRSGWRQHIWEVLPVAAVCLIWGIL